MQRGPKITQIEPGDQKNNINPQIIQIIFELRLNSQIADSLSCKNYGGRRSQRRGRCPLKILPLRPMRAAVYSQFNGLLPKIGLKAAK
jgi:hypothetical protein